MKYAAIITYTSGERTGATVTADTLGEAWRKLLGVLPADYVQSIEIAEILTPEREVN